MINLFFLGMYCVGGFIIGEHSDHGLMVLLGIFLVAQGNTFWGMSLRK